MRQDEMDNVLAFDAHELGTDAAGTDCDRWLKWAGAVAAILGHDLDGDSSTDGYSLDAANDLYEDGCSVEAAVAEFEALKLTVLIAGVS